MYIQKLILSDLKRSILACERLVGLLYFTAQLISNRSIATCILEDVLSVMAPLVFSVPKNVVYIFYIQYFVAIIESFFLSQLLIWGPFFLMNIKFTFWLFWDHSYTFLYLTISEGFTSFIIKRIYIIYSIGPINLFCDFDKLLNSFLPE